MKTSSLSKVIAGIGSVVVGAGIFYLLNKDNDTTETSGAEDSTARKYDADGYDTEGFDKNGYDREGFDRRGYNRRGLDRDGYNKSGYKNGFDRSGHNRYGYLITGYNDDGIDVSGKNTAFYFNEVHRMTEQISRAKKQMDIGEFDYALSDIRVGLEIGSKAFIRHYVGYQCIKDKLYDNLEICKKYLPVDFCEKLQRARQQCSPAQHDTEERGNKSYNQVYFARKTLEEFRDYLQNHLVTCTEVL